MCRVGLGWGLGFGVWDGNGFGWQFHSNFDEPVL